MRRHLLTLLIVTGFVVDLLLPDFAEARGRGYRGGRGAPGFVGTVVALVVASAFAGWALFGALSALSNATDAIYRQWLRVRPNTQHRRYSRGDQVIVVEHRGLDLAPVALTLSVLGHANARDRYLIREQQRYLGAGETILGSEIFVREISPEDWIDDPIRYVDERQAELDKERTLAAKHAEQSRLRRVRRKKRIISASALPKKVSAANE